MKVVKISNYSSEKWKLESDYCATESRLQLIIISSSAKNSVKSG